MISRYGNQSTRVTFSSTSVKLIAAAALLLCVQMTAANAAVPDSVTVSISPSAAVIENAQVRVRYDLRHGTYTMGDKGHVPAIVHAITRINQWASNESGVSTVASELETHNGMGVGKTLQIQSDRHGGPTLLLDISLYPGHGFVSLAAGIKNDTEKPIRIKGYHPLAAGELFPGGAWTDVQTLDGMSATHQTRVERGASRSSANDLLLTFVQGGQRHSVVMGALATSDFTKWVYTEGAGNRQSQIAEALPGAKLVGYLECGRLDASTSPGPTLRTVAGETYSFPVNSGDARFGDVLYEAKEARISASGLDPHKRYALGWSWWDYDGNGRIESVHIAGDQGGDQNLTGPQPLPQFLTRHQAPVQMARVIPSRCYSDGHLEIGFKNESSAPNAVVNEVWLWELPASEKLPANWIAGQPVKKSSFANKSDKSVYADLQATDPVGRLVDPGETYLPADSFYIDFTTSDPFAALEQYGQALVLATDAHPDLYDFPTVCAWYAGVWHTPGAQNHPEKSLYKINTTAGLVEEMHKVRDRGFLKYSRIAMRLVPDTYELNNPQGWWNDAHWQKYGYYVAPYETSQKFGHAIQQLGGLAFTYFQPECIWLALKDGSNSAALSQDFRTSHPDLLIGDDPRHSLDYTKPATQAYMRKVFAAMRGGISSIMFDYCDDFWMADATQGGFADPHATATSYYRELFKLAKQGLGPRSWIHERNLGRPNNDLTLGYVDLQRTSTDTDKITPDMVSRSGLRWYKNRVVISYDMDSKDMHGSWKIPGFTGSDTDGRRMMLTMEYVAGSRLLLANSFRDLSADELYDLERVVPFPTEHRSARPVDAFSHDGWPQVYDFAISARWHQLTLYNNLLPTSNQTIRVPLSGDDVNGALGLDPTKEYYFYDFWNDRFAGRLRGNETLSQTLRPGEARMLSVHEVEPNPQFISTNRHLMQGYFDLVRQPRWDAASKTLNGKSRVIAGEPYRIILATNGNKVAGCSAKAAHAEIKLIDPNTGLAALTIDSPRNSSVAWKVRFK